MAYYDIYDSNDNLIASEVWIDDSRGSPQLRSGFGKDRPLREALLSPIRERTATKTQARLLTAPRQHRSLSCELFPRE